MVGDLGDYDIMASWISVDGKQVILRRFAKNKIENKHLLSIKAAKYITQAALSIKQDGTTHVYWLPISRIRCGATIFSCKPVERREMKAVVNYRDLEDGRGSMGMITAYCPWSREVYGNDQCSDWVRRSPQFQ